MCTKRSEIDLLLARSSICSSLGGEETRVGCPSDVPWIVALLTKAAGASRMFPLSHTKSVSLRWDGEGKLHVQVVRRELFSESSMEAIAREAEDIVLLPLSRENTPVVLDIDPSRFFTETSGDIISIQYPVRDVQEDPGFWGRLILGETAPSLAV